MNLFVIRSSVSNPAEWADSRNRFRVDGMYVERVAPQAQRGTEPTAPRAAKVNADTPLRRRG